MLLGDCCQNRLKYDHLETEDLPYKQLYYSPVSNHLEPASKHSDLIGTMSAFNCLYLFNCLYFSDQAEICQ